MKELSCHASRVFGVGEAQIGKSFCRYSSASGPTLTFSVKWAGKVGGHSSSLHLPVSGEGAPYQSMSGCGQDQKSGAPGGMSPHFCHRSCEKNCFQRGLGGGDAERAASGINGIKSVRRGWSSPRYAC
jgi:hypothetical protein